MKNLIALMLLLGCGSVSADTDAVASGHSKHVIFAGAGSAERDDPFESDETPWVIGYIYSADTAFVGIDFAAEGTLVNNTSGRVNEIEQGFSINVLFGKNLAFNNDWRAGIGVLLGGRETTKSCPDSYLGYECYADETPDSKFDWNYGALLHLTFKRAFLGTRFSGESTQFMLGVAF